MYSEMVFELKLFIAVLLGALEGTEIELEGLRGILHGI
jgi:hypothetical protein